MFIVIIEKHITCKAYDTTNDWIVLKAIILPFPPPVDLEIMTPNKPIRLRSVMWYNQFGVFGAVIQPWILGDESGKNDAEHMATQLVENEWWTVATNKTKLTETWKELAKDTFNTLRSSIVTAQNLSPAAMRSLERCHGFRR